MDAETYLRLAFERMVAEPGRQQLMSEALVAGLVLRQVGALDDALVERVQDTYAGSFSIGGVAGHFLSANRTVPAVPLGPARVVPLDADVVVGDQTLHLGRVTLAADGVRIEVSGTDAEVARPRHPSAMVGPGMPGPRSTSLDVVDDRGTVASLRTHGWGGGGGSWSTHFESSTPLALDTTRLTVAGAGFDVPPRPAPAPARLEPVTPGDPALRAVTQLISNVGRMGIQQCEPAIEALAAVGLIDPEGADAEGLRRVAETLRAPGSPAGGLPAPWDRALARLGRTDGRSYAVEIGVAVGPLDGASYRLDLLESEPDVAAVRFVCSPGSELGGTPFTPARSHVLWWAEDDRGGLYAGSPAHEGGGAETAEGEVVLTGPLDPEATELRIIPTGRDQRAVVTVALPPP